MSFESIYIAQLPRIPMTEAYRRLERMREHLVAARTEIPIHFQQPVSRGAMASAGPYASLMRIEPNPADVNAAATERQAT